jgi:hypothetical protein
MKSDVIGWLASDLKPAAAMSDDIIFRGATFGTNDDTADWCLQR